MREILFRGKRKDNGEWVEGFLLKECNYATCSWNLAIEYKTDRFGKFAYDVAEVVTETVGQFTGLTDKNGKKIFEGDVVLYPWNDQDKPERFTIKFKDGQFVASPVKETEDYWDFMVGGYSKEMEVIGNIHDNPELLENP